MRKEIRVTDLCSEFEQEPIRQQRGRDSLKRYRKVLTEFSAYAGTGFYSQPLGTGFLVEKFQERGGLVTSDEQSKTEEYYFRCIRILTEYFNFGLIYTRTDIYGEIIWPEGFRACTEKFYASIIGEGLSYGYVIKSRKVIKDLILFLDAVGIGEPASIHAENNDAFIKSYYWLSPKGIEGKLCMLRRYYRFLYLHGFITIHLRRNYRRHPSRGAPNFRHVGMKEQ